MSETRSESNDDFATWQGSTLSAANMSINADVASLIGSDVNAGTLDLNADSILLGAGTHTQSNSFEQDSRNVGVDVSTSGAGSWNANAGYNEASSNSDATQHVNTQINVSHLNSTSDELTLRGAVVTANTANITTGTLTVESLQDTHKSKNSSMGVNVGVGAGSDSVGKPQSGSGGANFAKGDSEGAITNEQSAILIANGADSQITAKDTHLIGGMIANATWEIPEGADENTVPVLVDHGDLNFTTGTLTTTDLRDYSKSSQTGAGLQVSASTTTISATDEGHRMEGQTLATIGGGNVTVGGVALDEHEDFADLNRDVGQAQIVTLDQQTGAMNASVTFDDRMFQYSKKDGFYGWKSIANQHANMGRNWQLVSSALESDFRVVAYDYMPESVKGGLDVVSGLTSHMLPFNPVSNGSVLGGMPILLGSHDIHRQELVLISKDSDFYARNPDIAYMEASEHPLFHTLSPERQNELEGLYIAEVTGSISEQVSTMQNWTNGMLNNQASALSNALQQTHSTDGQGGIIGPVEVTLNFNPSRGWLGDIMEIGVDKVGGVRLPDGYSLGGFGIASGMARQTGIFYQTIDLSRPESERTILGAHSQGNVLAKAGLNYIDHKFYENRSFVAMGSPVNNDAMNAVLSRYGISFGSSTSNQGDFVSQGLGGNYGIWQPSNHAPEKSFVPAGLLPLIHLPLNLPNALLLKDSSTSPHSTYRCNPSVQICGAGL